MRASLDVHIPGLQCTSSMLNISPGSTFQGGSADAHIGVSTYVIRFMALQIADREMTYVRKMNPSLEWDKLSMALQGDYEMKELAIITLKTHTKYTWQIHANMNNPYGLERIIEEYTTNNLYNLKEEVL